MCIKQRASCAHPNGLRADKAEIRIKFIPFIGAGLSQQDPQGLPVSVGQATDIPISERPLNAARAIHFVFRVKTVSKWGSGRCHVRAKGSLESAWGLDLDPGLGRGCGTVGPTRCGEVQPKRGSILQGRQEMQRRMTWWGAFLSSLEGFFQHG